MKKKLIASLMIMGVLFSAISGCVPNNQSSAEGKTNTTKEETVSTTEKLDTQTKEEEPKEKETNKEEQKRPESISEQIRKELDIDNIQEDGKYSYNKNMAIFKELWNRSKKCYNMMENADDSNPESTVQEILKIIPCTDLQSDYNMYKDENFATEGVVRKNYYLTSILGYRMNLLETNLKHSDENVMNRVEEIIFSDTEGSGYDDIQSLYGTTDFGELMRSANSNDDISPLNESQLFAEYDQAEVPVNDTPVGQQQIQDKVQQQIGSESIGNMTLDELYDKLAEIDQQRFYDSLSPYEKFQYDLWSIKGPFN